MILDLSNRGLTTLQGIDFPNKVTELIIYNNLLTSLEHCPQGIQKLRCDFNQLTSLQYCPDNLQELYCSYNDLTSLQYCPKNLKKLWCNKNRLNSLNHLPKHLYLLHCGHNELISLQGCHDSLKILYSDNNPLSPEYQNKSLDEIKLINYTKRFEQGINIVHSLIIDQKARVIQRCWDQYWYKPNEQGISRHALQGIRITEQDGISIIDTYN